MRTKTARVALAVAGVALLIGGLALPAASALPPASPVGGAASVPRGDVPAGPMTRAQARAVYLDTVCPLNAAIAALGTATDAPDPEWSTVRSRLLAVAVQQVRVARALDHPTRPWPANVRNLIPAISAMDVYGAGWQEALSLAGSMERYQAMMTSSQATDLPGDSLVAAGVKAVTLVRARLGLPATGGCPSR